MDFRPSDAHRELAARTRAFAREHLGRPEAHADAHAFPKQAWKKLGAFGLLGLSLPQQYGGLGLDALGTALAIEALGGSCDDAGLVFSACAHLFACAMPVASHGSAALTERLLPALASGVRVGANAITEAEAGSDVHALRARAVRDGAHYRITGVKTYVTNGPIADVFVVYASTNPGHGHLGITAFVVERGADGLRVGAPFEKMGLASSPMSAVYLEDCRVPADHVLGREGDGAAVFASSMTWERACLFAAYLGAMERQLEATLRFARERRQFDKPIGKHQAVSHRIVDMKLRLDAARLLLYRACWLRDQGQDATLEISLAKLAVSEAAVQSSLDAIRVHGGMGTVVEAGIERGLRDAIPATIFSGTSDIQRELVARRLGL
jgi:alkylation response protein AidB-like acyl-CoA dehydrogenase